MEHAKKTQQKQMQLVIPHSLHFYFMQDTCMTVYTKEKMAKCRTAVIELLVKVGSVGATSVFSLM